MCLSSSSSLLFNLCLFVILFIQFIIPFSSSFMFHLHSHLLSSFPNLQIFLTTNLFNNNNYNNFHPLFHSITCPPNLSHHILFTNTLHCNNIFKHNTSNLLQCNIVTIHKTEHTFSFIHHHKYI